MKIKLINFFKGLVFALIGVALITSCKATTDSGGVAKADDSTMVAITKYSNSNAIEWKVKRKKTPEGTMVRDGISERYTKSGKLAETVTYVDNKKEGLRTYYYGDGKSVWKEIMYKGGKRNGMFKKYDNKGRLDAEMEYYQGFAGVGLVEYYDSGKKRPNARLSISESNEIRQSGNYKIVAKLTGEGAENIKKVEFYVGDLIEGKFINPKSRTMTPLRPLSKMSGELLLPVPRGSFIDKSVNIVAMATTKSGFKLILQKKVHVAVRGV